MTAILRKGLIHERGCGAGPEPCTCEDGFPLHRDEAADEIQTLRAIVRKLVIEPADTVGPAYICAGWLDATKHESAAVERALASGRNRDAG